MRELTGSERKHLRGRAHALEPVVQMGKHGLTAALLETVDGALEAHELIKVRLAVDRGERAETVARIERELDCRAAGTVGHVAILYRPHPDPEKRRTLLPDRPRDQPRNQRRNP